MDKVQGEIQIRRACTQKRLFHRAEQREEDAFFQYIWLLSPHYPHEEPKVGQLSGSYEGGSFRVRKTNRTWQCCKCTTCYKLPIKKCLNPKCLSPEYQDPEYQDPDCEDQDSLDPTWPHEICDSCDLFEDLKSGNLRTRKGKREEQHSRKSRASASKKAILTLQETSHEIKKEKPPRKFWISEAKKRVLALQEIAHSMREKCWLGGCDVCCDWCELAS